MFDAVGNCEAHSFAADRETQSENGDSEDSGMMATWQRRDYQLRDCRRNRSEVGTIQSRNNN